MRPLFGLALVTGIFALPLTGNAADEKKTEGGKKEKVTYVDHVLPILRVKCFACHNPDKKSGSLDLTNYSAMKTGGSSGDVIEAGDPDSSYLWLLVNHESTPYMPPKSEKLPDEMLSVIKKWIEGGALETKTSKAVVRPKAKVEFALSFAPTERPAGPPPVPARLSLEPVVHTETTTAVNAVATSPWAPLVAVSGQKQVLLYNTQTLKLVGVLPFPEGEAHALRFSRNGQLLMAGGGTGALQGKVIVWNVKTGERVIETGDELDCVLAADISGDNKYIALGGPAKVVRVYSTESGELLYESRKHTEWITSVQFSPDGVLLATGDRNGGVFVWEAETGREYLGLRGHSKQITGFGWRIDSNVLASASEDASVRLWEMENGREIKTWGAHGGGTSSVWFSRDGHIVTTGRDRTTKLWKGDGTAVRTFEAFGDLALQGAYCDETKRVIGADYTGVVRVWNAADGARVGELSTNPEKLATLLAQATAGLTQKQADAKAKNDAYTAAQNVVNQVKTNLGTAQKSVVDLTAKDKQLQATLTTAQQTATDAKTKHDAAATVVAALTPVVPPLKASLAAATEAAAKAPADKEVAAAVAQLKTVAAAREATLTASATTVAGEAARLAAAQKTATDTTKLVADNKAAIAAAQKQVETYAAALKVEEPKAVAAKQALDAANAAVTTSTAAVERWKGEIQFSAKLTQLKQKEDEAYEKLVVLAEAQEEMAGFQAKVTQAQAALAAAQKADKDAQAAVTTAQTEVTKQTGARDAQAKVLADREAAVPVLKDAVDKGAAATAAVKDDKELATAAAQLKAAFDRNNAAITAAKPQVEALKQAVTSAQTALAAVQQKLTQAKTVVAQATQKLQADQAAAKPSEQKVAQAKQAADQAKAVVDQLQAEIDQLRQQTTVAQN